METQRRRRLVVLSVLWLFLLAVVIAFRNVLLPFAAAATIAYLVAPLVDRIAGTRLGKVRVPRWVAILIIYALFFLLVYAGVIALLPQLYRELARISRELLALGNSLTPERIEQLAQMLEAWLAQRGLPIELSTRALEGASPSGGLELELDLQQLVREGVLKARSLVADNLGNLVGVTRSVVTQTLAAIFMLFFILMVAAYMSIDGKKISSYARSLLPTEYSEDVSALTSRIDRSLAGVVRGQVTICLVNGVLTFFGLILFGVKFAFLLATIATLFSLIPIFGSIISSVPIVAIGLSQGWKTGLAILGWIVGIHALEAYFLNPKIMGSAARIHPLIVAFALIAGERTFGLVGALFAVPIAAIAVACFDHARKKVQPQPESAVHRT